MSEKAVQEPCPKCGTVHTLGKYEPRPGTSQVAPRDVQCQCGLILRWSVPIFKTTASGYVLRVLRDNETPFLKEPT